MERERRMHPSPLRLARGAEDAGQHDPYLLTAQNESLLEKPKHEHGGPGVMSAIARHTRTRRAVASSFATFLYGPAGIMAFKGHHRRLWSHRGSHVVG